MAWSPYGRKLRRGFKNRPCFPLDMQSDVGLAVEGGMSEYNDTVW